LPILLEIVNGGYTVIPSSDFFVHDIPSVDGIVHNGILHIGRFLEIKNAAGGGGNEVTPSVPDGIMEAIAIICGTDGIPIGKGMV
jgi:hypothetical protein